MLSVSAPSTLLPLVARVAPCEEQNGKLFHCVFSWGSMGNPIDQGWANTNRSCEFRVLRMAPHGMQWLASLLRLFMVSLVPASPSLGFDSCGPCRVNALGLSGVVRCFFTPTHNSDVLHVGCILCEKTRGPSFACLLLH
jgi:hypothetical protein